MHPFSFASHCNCIREHSPQNAFMRFLIILALGMALGVVGYWYFTEGRRDPRVQSIERRVGEHAETVGDSIKQQVSQITVESIREELERTGRVIRQKLQQTTAVFRDDGADGSTAAELRAKLANDPVLAARPITVVARQGQVTLSGSVASHEEIARAMQLAFQLEGVREVVSELQVRRVKPGGSP